MSRPARLSVWLVPAVLTVWCLSNGRWPSVPEDGALFPDETAYRNRQAQVNDHELHTPAFQLTARLMRGAFPNRLHLALHVLNLAALAAACALSAATFGKDGRERFWLAGAAWVTLLASHALPAFRATNLHGLAALYFGVGLWLSLRPGLHFFAGAAFAWSAAYSPALAMALLPLAVMRRGRLLAGVAAGALFYFALAPDLWIDYLERYGWRTWSAFRAAENVSPTAFLLWFGGASPGVSGGWAVTLSHLLGGAACLAFLVLLGVSTFEQTEHGLAVDLALGLPIGLVTATLLHPVLPAALLVALPALGSAWNLVEKHTWARLALLAVAVGMGLSLLPGSPDAAYPLASFGLCLAAGATLAWMAVRVLGTKAAAWTRLLGLAAWLGQRERPAVPAVLCALALGLTLWSYAIHGFHPGVVLGWCAALAWGSCALDDPKACLRALPRAGRRDRRALAWLALVFAPLYLWNSFGFPVQVCTDELNIICCEQALLNYGSYDFLGLTESYFNFPSGCFVFQAVCTSLFGGPTLGSLRFFNGLLGILAIGLIYLLARRRLPRMPALACAAIFGACHPFFIISRMALRDTIPVLLLIAALLLLYQGWARAQRGLVYAGGVVAGLGVYNYYSGRVIVAVGLAGLGFVALARARQGLWPGLRRPAAAAGVWLLGFGLCAAPMALATWKAREAALRYQNEQTMLTPEGRRLAMHWLNAPDECAAFVENALRGLGAFNNNRRDASNMYINERHGFVDPLTGILLWIGVLTLLVRRKRAFDRLMLAGFLLTWSVVSVLVNKNPAYCRMLVTLPFAAYFAGQGAWWLAFRAARLARKVLPAPSALRCAMALLLAGAVAIWNGWIVYAHYRHAVEKGDTVGATVRYVASRADAPIKRFYLVTDERDPFFWYGGDLWPTWLAPFTHRMQEVELLRPLDLAAAAPPFQPASTPCVLLMNGEVWRRSEARLRSDFPGLSVVLLTPDAQQVAVELP